MFDHQIAKPGGWQTAWLDRTFAPLTYYTGILILGIVICAVAIGVHANVTARRNCNELEANGRTNSDTADELDKIARVAGTKHHYISLTYHIHAIILILVDAVISAITLSKSVIEAPEIWTTQFCLRIALLCVGLIALFVVCFCLVPLLEMLLATFIFSRLRKDRGGSLEAWTPEARSLSTSLAQAFCAATFLFVRFWEPSESSLARYTLIQALMGSATAWLEASYAFNFCHKTMLDNADDLYFSSGGVKDLIKLFGKTAKTVHGIGDKSAVLPQYATVQEKSPLLVAVGEDERGAA